MSALSSDLKPTPDQAAAQQFLTELRTRISTQPLPYQYGVEAQALTSMWEVFHQARDAIEKNPGCEQFANKTTHVLNIIIRPLMAMWHRSPKMAVPRATAQIFLYVNPSLGTGHYEADYALIAAYASGVRLVTANTLVAAP